jgi:hypothetical protein
MSPVWAASGARQEQKDSKGRNTLKGFGAKRQ